MREESKQITDEILSFINRQDYDDDAFNTLALKLFKYQFTFNLPYKKYCHARRKTPLTVSNWRDIPPLPIQGFKELPLSCEKEESSETVFMTSGTTTPEKRGRNVQPRMEVWDTSMIHGFRRFVMRNLNRMTILVISPAEDLNQNSSLSRYLAMAVEHFGDDDSQLFFKEAGLDVDSVIKAVEKAVTDQRPVMIMGASFAYVHLLEYLHEKNIKFSLPKESILFDTGGFKGQSREITRTELYNAFEKTLGIPRHSIINMYGMTELSSQIYDQTFVRIQNEQTDIKAGPHWIQTRVLDPNTLKPVENGETGVLAHYDLCNWNSCMAVLTEDIGYQTSEGFILLGRAQGSEAKGCSIAVDELLTANQK